MLERHGAAEHADVRRGSLPYGDERRVAIARALVGRPRFLLLDEPAAGLNEAESDELLESLIAIQSAYGLRPPGDRARHEPDHAALPDASRCSTTAGRSPSGRPRGEGAANPEVVAGVPRRPGGVDARGHDLHIRYGSIAALRGISLEVRAGEAVGLIGAERRRARRRCSRRSRGSCAPLRGTIRLEGERSIGRGPRRRSCAAASRSCPRAGRSSGR